MHGQQEHEGDFACLDPRLLGPREHGVERGAPVSACPSTRKCAGRKTASARPEPRCTANAHQPACPRARQSLRRIARISSLMSSPPPRRAGRGPAASRRTASIAASMPRPCAPRHLGDDRAEADRRVDRDADDEHAVERRPREAAARTSQDLGRREAAAHGDDHRGEMHDDAARQHRRASPLQQATAATGCVPHSRKRPRECRQRRRTLETGDRRRGRELLRAALGAALVRMTGVAPGVACDRREPLGTRAVARIVDERPGAVQRRRAQIRGIPARRRRSSRNRRRSRCTRSPRRPRAALSTPARSSRSRRGASPSGRTQPSPARSCRRTRACRSRGRGSPAGWRAARSRAHRRPRRSRRASGRSTARVR